MLSFDNDSFDDYEQGLRIELIEYVTRVGR